MANTEKAPLGTAQAQPLRGAGPLRPFILPSPSRPADVPAWSHTRVRSLCSRTWVVCRHLLKTAPLSRMEVTPPFRIL